jgi:hypothetical protein
LGASLEGMTTETKTVMPTLISHLRALKRQKVLEGKALQNGASPNIPLYI